MTSSEFTLAKLIIREQRYFSLKGFTRKGFRRKRRSLTSFVRRNYIASVISFSLLSLGLSAIKYFEAPASSTFSVVTVVLFFYLLIAGAYNALFFFSQVKAGNILDPSMSLPNVRLDLALTLSFIYYYASSTAFVTIPAAFAYSILFLDPAAFFVLLAWTAIYSLMGLGLGSAVLLATGGMMQKRSGRRRMAFSAIKILAIIFAFFLFEMWIYDPSLLPSSMFDHFSIFFAFVPIFNVASTSFYAHGLTAILLSIYSISIYVAVALSMLGYSRSALMRFFTETRNVSAVERGQRKPNGRRSLNSSLIKKDIAIVFRSPQNSIMIFLPLVLSLPLIVPVSLAGDTNPLGIYYIMLEFPVISASFFPIVMLISEARGITSMFSLPVDLLHFIRSKFAVSFYLFFAMSVALAILIAVFGHVPALSIILIEVALVTGFSSVLTVNFLKNSSRINDSTTILNFDSFGGNAGLMWTFARSLLIILAPVLISDLIVYSIYFSFSNTTLILSLDALFNTALMLLLINKGIRKASGKQIAAYT